MPKISLLLYTDEPTVLLDQTIFWHVDGHHKLIKWKLVTHGGIDGFSRDLKCSNNNTAETPS